jgi:hypothetical protein
MALTRFISEQAVLDLVASDFSYKPDNKIAINGDKLSSFPDSSMAHEHGFPASLVSALDNALSSPTHRTPIASGLSVIQFDNWVVANKFDDGGDGYGAVVFKSKFADPVTHKFDYIVAFRGTDGINAQDWFANLDLAGAVWARQSSRIVPYLLGVGNEKIDQATLGRIHFTGQSLGGGLAQYAAYTYAQQRKVADGRFSPSSISLITFNAFGGVRGLQALNTGQYDPTLLGGVDTAHFVIDNDIIHKLGAGDPKNLAAIGGSWHVNGASNTYQLNFAQKKDGRLVRTESGRVLKLDMVSAHRIEAGFYYGFDAFQDINPNFSRVDPVRIDYLDTQNSQSVGAALSRVANKGLTTEMSAGARLIVGLAAIGIAGQRAEVRKFSRALLDGWYASADVSWRKRLAFEILALPEAIRLMGNSLAKTAVATAVLAVGIETFGGLDQADKANIWSAVNSFLPTNRRVSAPSFILSQSIGEGDRALMYELTAVALASRGGETDIDAIINNPKQRDFARALAPVALDGQQLLNSFASGLDWIINVASYIQRNAALSGITGEALATFDLSLIDLLNSETTRLGVGDTAFQDRITAATSKFIREDLGWALANSRPDFTARYQLASLSAFFNTRLDFIQYDRIHEALESASRDPKFAAIRAAIGQALQPIEAAGQTIVIEESGANPFKSPTFDPDAGSAASSVLVEDGARSFTLYLPYAAGELGQKIRLSFSGDAANVLRVIIGGELVTPASGGVLINVSPGQRQESFAITTRGDFDTDEAVAVSATLLDANGNPTHKTNLELNLKLDARQETPASTPITGTDISPNHIIAPPGGATLQGWGFLEGGAGNDHLIGDRDTDWLTGNLGNNWMEGGAGGDVIILGQGEDYADGGAGFDLIGYFGADVYPESLVNMHRIGTLLGLMWGAQASLSEAGTHHEDHVHRGPWSRNQRRRWH